MERAVRGTKRRIAVGQAEGLDMAADRYLLGRQQARLAAHVKANRLTRDYSRERAYGVAQQPRAYTSTPRQRARVAEARAGNVRSVLGRASGGSASGPMEELGRIDPKDRAMVAEAVRQCKDSVRGQPVEHAWVLAAGGQVKQGRGPPAPRDGVVER